MGRSTPGIARSVIAVASLVTIAPLASAQPGDRFTAADVFRLRSVGDVRISPDGRTVAYEAIDTDIMTDGRRRSIRVVEVATGADRLVATDARSPRWSPDGRSLAYSDRADGADRLMIVARTGGAPWVIARLTGSPSAVSWSRDGRLLAFTRFVPRTTAVVAPTPPPPEGARWAPPPRVVTSIRHDEDGGGIVEPGQTQLFVIPAAGGTPRQVTNGPLHVIGDAAWMPDGRALVYAAVALDRFGPGFRSGRLFRVPVDGGAPVALSSPDLAAQSPAVSPDGRRVAFVAWAVDGRDFSPIRLRVMDAAGGASRVIEPDLDRDVTSATWSADGRSLYAGYADRSIDKVRRIPLDGSAAADVAADLAGEFTVSERGVIAYPKAGSARPADVAIKRSEATGPTQLTRRNEAMLSGKSLGTTVPLAVRSSLDGAMVGAWLTRPADYAAGRRYPLILDIHGGPYGYDGPVWQTRDQLYAAAGYAVLHVNYRGSTSYGFAFADRIAADPLAPSYADLMSAVDAAVGVGIADPARLYVTGGSAGGELTAWIVGHTNRFRAAMAEKPITNRMSYALTSDQYTSAAIIAGPAPWNDAARLWSLSPLSTVGRVTTPTMLIVGEEDRRTPPGEAEQFYHALTLRGVPTALVLVPEASHATLGSRPSQLVAMARLTLDWFERQSASPVP